MSVFFDLTLLKINRLITKLFSFFFLLVYSIWFSQDLVSGNVSSEYSLRVSQVLVMNMRTEEKALTNTEGSFSIRAVVGDELRFVKKNYERISKRLNYADFQHPLSVVLKASVITIQEVEVNQFKATGNIKNDAKKLDGDPKVIALNEEIRIFRKEKPTDFERKLETPKDFQAPNTSAGQFNLLALIGFAYKLVKGKDNSKPIFYPSQRETEAFLITLIQDLGEEYFKSMELSESEIDAFLKFSNQRLSLAQKYIPDYNLQKIKIEMEKILISYKNKR